MESESSKAFIEFSTKIKSNEKEFKITLSQKLNNLNIKIIKLNSLPQLNFENEFTKTQLDKISKFFKMFDDINDLIPELSEKIKNNNYSLVINELYIQLNIETKIKNIQNFSLVIYKKDNLSQNNNETLYGIINNILKDNEFLKNEIKEQKEEILKLKNEIKEIKYTINMNIVNFNEIDSKILTNTSDIQLISNWIKPNKKIKFKLLFRSSRDGDRISTFTSKVSGKYPTLIIIKSNYGFKFGGFTSEQWNMTGSYSYKSDPTSFIFSIDKKKKYNLKDEECIYSICGDPQHFAFGGGHDLTVWDNFTTNDNSKDYICNFSYSMEEKYELTDGKNNFFVKELEVFEIDFE